MKKVCELNDTNLLVITGGICDLGLGVGLGVGLTLCTLGTLGIVDSYKNTPANKHKRRAKYVCSILSVVIGCLLVGISYKTNPKCSFFSRCKPSESRHEFEVIKTS